MKPFLKRTLLFLLLPVVITGIIEAFVLPPNYFTYRSWEALIFKNPIPHMGGFYPNMHTEMAEQGDLAFRTRFAVTKEHVQWTTDKLGFRNETFVEEPDVLFIGDSFTAGVTLNQDETISSRVGTALGGRASVYNMAPSSFGNFSFLYKEHFVRKPKVLVFSIVERLAPVVLTVTQEENDRRLKYLRKINKVLVFKGVNTVIDRLTAFNSFKWAASRINQRKGAGAQSPVDSSVFFMEGVKKKFFTLKNAEATAKVILSYKKYCDELGIAFIFMPMPDKESVYYNLVPFQQQPQYLLQLDSILQQSGVATINTLGIYNRIKDSTGTLYKPDDTHWNEVATKIIGNEVAHHPLLQQTLKIN